jgi:hypothetical protein
MNAYLRHCLTQAFCKTSGLKSYLLLKISYPVIKNFNSENFLNFKLKRNIILIEKSFLKLNPSFLTKKFLVLKLQYLNKVSNFDLRPNFTIILIKFI